ncbi:hypothetical protein DPMN_127510 [Dreissena polymorpha]|uniref:Uncharacterized protein n=1 Tax=Dreissena polymorpha TaxID=45954 RepID=A0A9D4H258_DREPO|nr:hypothetical protein DPMN_127510 [Dreissena polymorpha]
MRRDFAGRSYFGPLMKYVRGIGGSPSPPHFLKRIYANLRSDIRDNPIRGNPRIRGKITPLANYAVGAAILETFHGRLRRLRKVFCTRH